jgi:hypothetical protein
MRSLPVLTGLAGETKSEASWRLSPSAQTIKTELPRGLSPVSPLSLSYRIGTTFRSLATFIALAERLPVDAFRMYSLHQAIIGRRRSISM